MKITRTYSNVKPKKGRGKELKGLYPLVRHEDMDLPEDFIKAFSGRYESPRDYILRAAKEAERCLSDVGIYPAAREDIAGVEFPAFGEGGDSSTTLSQRVSTGGQCAEYWAYELLGYCRRAFSLLEAGKPGEALEDAMHVVNAYHYMCFHLNYEHDVLHSRKAGKGRSGGGTEKAKKSPPFEVLQRYVENLMEKNQRLKRWGACKKAESHFVAHYEQGTKARTIYRRLYETGK